MKLINFKLIDQIISKKNSRNHGERHEFTYQFYSKIFSIILFSLIYPLKKGYFFLIYLIEEDHNMVVACVMARWNSWNHFQCNINETLVKETGTNFYLHSSRFYSYCF